MFEAIEVGDTQRVQAILTDGQDPNCVLLDSALVFAISTSCCDLVQVLLRGNASPDFTPVGGDFLRIA